MIIKVGINTENANEILEEVMECINRVAGDMLQWKKHKTYNYYETEYEISENDIIPVFNELIAQYPELDIDASYLQDIREDDTSAQWWRTTTIKTEHHPEGSTLSFDSRTYWF